MRITNKLMVEHAVQNMSGNLERLGKLQGRIASGKQFQSASEDPARASVSLSLRSNLRTLESYADTAETTKYWMTATDSAFDQIEQVGNRAINLILRGLNDSLSGPERATALGTEIQALLVQALDLGNSSMNGQFIFSGYQVNRKAFELVDDTTTLLDYKGDPFTAKVVNYLGDQGIMQRSLGPDQSVTLNVRGDQALEGFLQNLELAGIALRQNDTTALRTALGDLRTSLDTMDQHRTSNGARLRQVDSASGFLETMKIETQSLLSNNEDLNLAEGIAQLAHQETTYNAVLEVSRRAISALSLFDYLR